jgi:hypothetical protein
MSVILQTDLLNAMMRVVGDINKNRDIYPVYVDLVVAYYDFRYEIIVRGVLEGIGFYSAETRISGDVHDLTLKGLFETIDDFMSGNEKRIDQRKQMMLWARG